MVAKFDKENQELNTFFDEQGNIIINEGKHHLENAKEIIKDM